VTKSLPSSHFVSGAEQPLAIKNKEDQKMKLFNMDITFVDELSPDQYRDKLPMVPASDATRYGEEGACVKILHQGRHDRLI